jgi:uncharacterized protein YicC (UPF0701 family)
VPRVHQRKAAKDYPSDGIAKGETYYTWSIKLQRGGLVKRSKTYPKPQQLTTSEYRIAVLDLIDRINDAEDIDALRSVADDIRELANEQQEKLDNMPEGLQQGATGELIQERQQECESWADDVDAACDQLESTLSDIDDEEAEANPENEDDEARDFESERMDALQEAKNESAPSF